MVLAAAGTVPAEEDKVARLRLVGVSVIGIRAFEVTRTAKLVCPVAAAYLTPDILLVVGAVVAVVLSAPVAHRVLVGTVGLIKRPSNEGCTPVVVAAAVAYAEVAHIVVEFGVVTAAAADTVKIVLGGAFLISELRKRNRNNVGSSVARDFDFGIVFVIFTAKIRGVCVVRSRSVGCRAYVECRYAKYTRAEYKCKAQSNRNSSSDTVVHKRLLCF